MFCMSKDISDLSSELIDIEEKLEQQSAKVRCFARQTTLDSFFEVASSRKRIK